MLSGDSSSATNAGFCLIGYSGCGKSSAINILVSHYPQVIMHVNDEHQVYYPQITYLVVNCVTNSNFSALYQSIGDAIDKAFGNTIPVYAREIERTKGLGNKAEKIRELVEKFSVGIIIFDEIQLIDFNHTKENTFDSLLTLANRTKVAIAVVGTEDARDKMFHELRTSRRIGTMINGNMYCSNIQFFEVLVKTLFSYQWFDNPITPDSKMISSLYDVTKGIVDQLIGVYSCMNYDYLNKKNKPIVNADYVYSVAKKYYPGMQQVLSNLQSDENIQQITDMRLSAELKLNHMLDRAKQEDEVNRLIVSASDNADLVINLKNIVVTITALYDFSYEQIEETFNKIMKKKSSEGMSEKQIGRLIIKTLQNNQTRKAINKKSNTPNIQNMQNFLKIEGEE